MSATHSSPYIEFIGITKSFGDTRANDGISLQVRAGSIHGIVGENGAGKSTAMKILYGLYRADSGVIRIDGRPVKFRSPSDAIALGVGMVHQHFMLSEVHSALDNVLLGAEPVSKPLDRLPAVLQPIARAQGRERLESLSRHYGMPVSWESKIESLSVGEQQRVEILKLLYRNANILILDEPTAVLTPQEIQSLFKNLRRMRDEGKTILIITHKLKEVMALTDRVTVFRGGRVVGQKETSQTDERELAELMVGRAVDLGRQAPKSERIGQTVLAVDRLHYRQLDLSLEVRSGEIVGIAGVEGNGQSDLLKILFHSQELFRKQPGSSGKISMLGADVTALSAREIKKMGIAYVPEDRHRDGLLLGFSLEDNFLLGWETYPEFTRSFGIPGVRWIDHKKLHVSIARALENFDIRPRRSDVAAQGLSGGNQQKWILAREFERNPKLIVIAQPTRGVDVGAIEQIHSRIVAARDAGAGVLLVSSELDEVMALSDRILVMARGKIVATFSKGSVHLDEIGLAMGGVI